jgi:hypothetical protein
MCEKNGDHSTFASNAQLVSMADSYFLNFLLLDVASVSLDISSDFLNRASHILQIQPSSDPCAFTLHTAANAENNDCIVKNMYAFCNT